MRALAQLGDPLMLLAVVDLVAALFDGEFGVVAGAAFFEDGHEGGFAAGLELVEELGDEWARRAVQA